MSNPSNGPAPMDQENSAEFTYGLDPNDPTLDAINRWQQSQETAVHAQAMAERSQEQFMASEIRESRRLRTEIQQRALERAIQESLLGVNHPQTFTMDVQQIRADRNQYRMPRNSRFPNQYAQDWASQLLLNQHAHGESARPVVKQPSNAAAPLDRDARPGWSVFQSDKCMICLASTEDPVADNKHDDSDNDSKDDEPEDFTTTVMVQMCPNHSVCAMCYHDQIAHAVFPNSAIFPREVMHKLEMKPITCPGCRAADYQSISTGPWIFGKPIKQDTCTCKSHTCPWCKKNKQAFSATSHNALIQHMSACNYRSILCPRHCANDDGSPVHIPINCDLHMHAAVCKSYGCSHTKIGVAPSVWLTGDEYRIRIITEQLQWSPHRSRYIFLTHGELERRNDLFRF